MNTLEQKEFETKILHLIRTQQTCKNIAEDMLNLANKLGWLDAVKVGHNQLYPISGKNNANDTNISYQY